LDQTRPAARRRWVLTMTELTKHRNELEERLIEEICDAESNGAIRFLGIEDEIEERVSQKIEKLSDEQFEVLWDEYIMWSIEDEIADMEEE